MPKGPMTDNQKAIAAKSATKALRKRVAVLEAENARLKGLLLDTYEAIKGEFYDPWESEGDWSTGGGW